MTGKHAETSGASVPDDAHGIEETPGIEDAPSIEEQRAEVAETVAALAAKADVPARVQNEAAFQADRAKAVAQENPQILAAAVGGVLAALLVTVILRRRRSRRSYR
ncbi:MAG: hypothetical protein WBQ44_13775 [Rhodococcus sp. (in: high G+C Gram-positive bacteria)]